MKGTLRRVVKRTPLRHLVRQKAALVGKLNPKRVVRKDPIPQMQPLPDARYLFAVGMIPRNYGGRTASILNKTRLLAEAGVDTEILTMNYSAELPDIVESLRESGALADRVSVVNLHEILGGQPDPDAEVIEHPVDVPDLVWEKLPNSPVYRYYSPDGVYRMYRRYDRHGRLLVEDHFNPNRSRVLRHDFDRTGRIRRTTYHDLYHNKQRQEIYYRPDGTPYMNRWHVVDPNTLATSIIRVTLFDEDGAITRVMSSPDEVIQEYLDRLVGDDHVFLSVESRASDKETLPWHRPNVKQIYVFHNPHLSAPYNEPSKVRPIYAPVLEARNRIAATVFLTESQRADAEAHFGKTKSWKVIPHAVKGIVDHKVERDPKLVVMLARLDQQKRLSHGIRAFQHVIARVPDARLEIWGQGSDRAELNQLITSLGLQDSVKLMGYTKSPDLVYQRATVTMLTSKYEGFGLVIQESLMNGCPVVSYDINYGPSDIIRDGQNGFLVPAGGIKRLASKVADILENPELASRLRQGAEGVEEDFSRAVTLARWSALFNELDAQGWGDAAD